MSKRITSIVLASIIFSCLAFSIIAFSPLQSAHAATVKPVAIDDFSAAYCSAVKDTGSVWQFYAQGGFVGDNSSSPGAVCDGSYYSTDSVTYPYASASWNLNSPSTVTTGYIWVYIPANTTGATNVTYVVTAFSSERDIYTFVLNQSNVAGWYRLGQITYGAGLLSVNAEVNGNSQGNLLVDAVTVSDH